jgi:hypothetical protein
MGLRTPFRGFHPRPDTDCPFGADGGFVSRVRQDPKDHG